MAIPIEIYLLLSLLTAYYCRHCKLGFIGSLCATLLLTPVVTFVAIALLNPPSEN